MVGTDRVLCCVPDSFRVQHIRSDVYGRKGMDKLTMKNNLKTMDLSTYKFPETTKVDLAFSNFNVTKELLEEAEKRNLTKGRKKFNELFFSGGQIQLKDDVKGTWKENAFMYARALMGSFSPKHEHKEAVCAMIFEECLVL